MFQTILKFLGIRVRSEADREVADAMSQFTSRQRELQRVFLERAAAAGKPRGLRWAGCEWTESRRLLRERSSGLLTLVAGVNLKFEAIEGGDMEDVEAVRLIREASAVFHFQNGAWGTGGRVLFNLPPDLAAERLSESYLKVSLP